MSRFLVLALQTNFLRHWVYSLPPKLNGQKFSDTKTAVHNRRKLLVDCGISVTELIEALYQISKELNPSLSLSRLAAKSEMTSKGYLSDILHGKRPLSIRRAPDLGRAFGLEELDLQIFILRVELENSKSENKRDLIHKKLAATIKALNTENVELPKYLKPNGMDFEVFCAIGLFKDKCTRQDLLRHFGIKRSQEVDASLRSLVQISVVEIIDSKIKLSINQVSFTSGKSEDRIEFIQHALEEAQEKLPEWFSHRDTAYFETVVISVKKRIYQEFLAQFRTEINSWLSHIESDDADDIIRVNIQAYPLRKP